MRIGIFGGSFDPPHRGHAEIAKMAMEQVSLDKLIMLPTGNPPHKTRKITDGSHRLAMCRMVVDQFGFELSAYEINKTQYCYTADTVEYFSVLYPQHQLFLIVGADSIRAMDGWMQPERIFACCTIIAANRDMESRKSGEFLQEKYNANIIWLENPMIDISSTQIRSMAKQGLDISRYVTKEVGEYIINNHLYR